MRLTSVTALAPPFSFVPRQLDIVPGAEYQIGRERTQYRDESKRLHYRLGKERTQYRVEEEHET